MISLTTTEQALLEQGSVVPRDFIWIVARNRSTGGAETFGAWSDLGDVSVPVLDPSTGQEITRTYRGIGAVISLSDVPLVAGLVVQSVTLTLNNIEPDVITLARQYDLTRARVELHRGYLDPQSRTLAAPARPRFSGFVDQESDVIAPAGENGALELELVSEVQDLTRSSKARRSDADQRLRSETDGFFRHVPVVPSWKIFWGQRKE